MTVTTSTGLTERRTTGDADVLISGEALSRLAVVSKEELELSLGASETEKEYDGRVVTLTIGTEMDGLGSKEGGENGSDSEALSLAEGIEEDTGSLLVLLGAGNEEEAAEEGTRAEMELAVVLEAAGVLDSNDGLGNAEGELEVIGIAASGVGLEDTETEEETEAVGDEG